MKPSLNDKGQSLIEFVLITPALALALIGSFWIGGETFRRTECSRIVFEAVHQSVHGKQVISRVALVENENGVKGEKKCGLHTETLFLPRLGKRK